MMRAFVLAHAAAFGFEADGDDVAAGGVAGFVGGDEDIGVAAFGAERAFGADEAEAAGGAAEDAGEVFGVAGRFGFQLFLATIFFAANDRRGSGSNCGCVRLFAGLSFWCGEDEVARAPEDLAGFDHSLDGFFEFVRGFAGEPQLFGDHRRFDGLVVGVVDVFENFRV